jgi:tungstate transport system ATP-binding protein
MSVPEAMLSAEGLKVALGGVQVLDIPSFHIHEREVVTIVGPNGSGKTTLLLALACLLKPVAGHISYRGEPLRSHHSGFQYRRNISMVFQEPLLFDTTVFNNVAAGLKIRGLSKSDSKDRVMKYLKCFHCDHLAHRDARKLSGGESQRTSLARAFAFEPEIIFLDEPFTALDPPTRHGLIHDLEKIVTETGTTTVMVTHLESEALSMSGRIAVMSGGQIIQTGSQSMVMNSPANDFVAKYVGMENILNGTVLNCRDGLLAISVLGRELFAAGRAQSGEEVHCCLRPENIAVTARDPGLSGNRNVFAGQITHIYSNGPFLRLILDCGFPLIAFVTREVFADLELTEGKKIHASFQPSAIHVIEKMGTSHESHRVKDSAR